MKFSVFAVLASFVVCIAPVSAHHSFAPHYDPDVIVTFTGTVTQLQYRNPHSSLRVEVVSETGTTDVWTCEMNAAGYLRREGITQDAFKVGEEITVTGAVARRDPHRCRVYVATTADGNRMTLFRGAAPDDVIEGFESVNDSMFGTWLIVPGSETLGAARVINEQLGPHPFDSLLTAAGRAAHAQYDQTIDDPSLRCVLPGPWRAWWDPMSPFLIERSNDRIVIRHEYFDGIREVHLDQPAIPSVVTPSPLGYSIGQFDGETLSIETTGFSTGVWIPHPGVLMNADARLYEQIRFDDETRQLQLEWQLEDPEFYDAPLIGEFTFESTALQLEPYNCIVEGGG